MTATPDFFEMEQSSNRRTKNSLGNFLMDTSFDPRNISADGLSAIVDLDSDNENSGGVRETPTCEELAMEGESMTKQGEYKEAIPLLEAALEMDSDDSQLHSVLWSLLGNAHFYLGEYERAVMCHSHDLAICCGLQDEKSKAQAYCNLGIAHRKQGFLQRAKMCYESYLEICEQLEDCKSISKANYNIGDLHLTLGRLMLQKSGGKIEEAPDAREHLQMSAMYFEKHLEYIKENGSKGAEARAHACLGLVYEMMKDTDRAIDHHQKRLKFSQEIVDKANEGRSYVNIGNCLRAILQPDKSLECYKRGLTIATELSDDMGIGVCRANLGITNEALGKPAEAVEHHEEHYECMKKVQSLEGQVLALSSLAKSYESLANLTKACEALDKLAELHKKSGKNDHLNEVLTHLTQLGGTPGCSNTGGGGGGGSTSGGTTGVTTGDKSPSASVNKKPGGLFKKLKDKRAKKRSIVGTEIHLGSFDSEGGWRTGSPVGEERKSIMNRKPAVKKESKEHRKGSISSRDDIMAPSSDSKSPDSLNSSRRRSWSHGNINKIASADNYEIKAGDGDKKVPHSDSVNFRLGEGTQSSQEESVPSDRYVINGPSSVDQLSQVEVSKDELKPLYLNFGNESHRQTLRDLREFLDSSGETEPLDLTILQDWNGWVIGSSDVVIQSTKESKLI